MPETPTAIIDGRPVAIANERNVLELCRTAGIDIPTFCYHSQLSVYGACRLCLVDIEGQGVTTSCTAEPVDGMVIRTHTAEIREMRKVALELLLANHDRDCPSCPRSGTCRLQELANRMGVDEVRFPAQRTPQPIDASHPAVVRNPNRCVLCGDCVRMCHEVQSVGAIDFAHRGARSAVLPAHGRALGEVGCVGCGQCAAVCPTGALSPASEIDGVWAALHDPRTTVVAQIAPAVRVALGEDFGLPAGENVAGRAVAALHRLGCDQVYDTGFTADLTVLEEGSELMRRLDQGGPLPQFTSCCPGWVGFAEREFDDLLPHLSTCRSPQQMFGSLARRMLPAELGCEPERLVVLSIMPCTAKKAEARRAAFAPEGRRDVDFVLTTQELTRMIRERGLDLAALDEEPFDMPLGFKTGAGIIFGTSGGVTEAALRFCAESMTGRRLDAVAFHAVRGSKGLREATVELAGTSLRVAIAHSLGQARGLAEAVRAGTSPYHLIEIMACPGGCVGGAGQPLGRDTDVVARRTTGLYRADARLQLHKSQENHLVRACYADLLGHPGSACAHELLHTHHGEPAPTTQGV